MALNDYRTITFDRAGKVLTVTLNRPDVLNAVNAELHEELSRVFYDLQTDEAEVIVLTGAGRAFCAGGDIDWMQRGIDEPQTFETTIVVEKKIIFGLLDLEKPVVCRLNGDAVGWARPSPCSATSSSPTRMRGSVIRMSRWVWWPVMAAL